MCAGDPGDTCGHGKQCDHADRRQQGEPGQHDDAGDIDRHKQCGGGESHQAKRQKQDKPEAPAAAGKMCLILTGLILRHCALFPDQDLADSARQPAIILADRIAAINLPATYIRGWPRRISRNV